MFPAKGGLRNEMRAGVAGKGDGIGSVGGFATSERVRRWSRHHSRRLSVHGSRTQGCSIRDDDHGGFRPAVEGTVAMADGKSDETNWVLSQFYSTLGEEEGHNISCFSAK